jgi:hypothetical protein
MCGPTSSEMALQGQSQSFATQLQSNYGTLFGQQQGVLNSLNRSLSPTLAAGPSQEGFSASEKAALNTQAINSAGAANRSAQQAAANFGAGQGGGAGSGIQSGITKQIQSSIASQSANALAGQQNNIVQQDYAKGSQNYWAAEGAMQQLGQQYSPNSAQSGAISEGGQAFSEANTIAQQQAQEDQAIAGGITSLATNIVAPGIGGALNAPAGGSAAAGFFGALGKS